MRTSLVADTAISDPQGYALVDSKFKPLVKLEESRVMTTTFLNRVSRSTGHGDDIGAYFAKTKCTSDYTVVVMMWVGVVIRMSAEQTV